MVRRVRGWGVVFSSILLEVLLVLVAVKRRVHAEISFQGRYCHTSQMN